VGVYLAGLIGYTAVAPGSAFWSAPAMQVIADVGDELAEQQHGGSDDLNYDQVHELAPACLWDAENYALLIAAMVTNSDILK
jgi:hypothetical protein